MNVKNQRELNSKSRMKKVEKVRKRWSEKMYMLMVFEPRRLYRLEWRSIDDWFSCLLLFVYLCRFVVQWFSDDPNKSAALLLSARCLLTHLITTRISLFLLFSLFSVGIFRWLNFILCFLSLFFYLLYFCCILK